MNPRIFVGAAAAAIAVAIIFVAVAGQNPAGDTGWPIPFPQSSPASIEPLVAELDRIEIVSVNERSATVDLYIRVSNPNQRSVILQLVQYSIYDEDGRVHAGQIGERFEGFVEGSNFYTVLAGSHTVLEDRIILKNTGNTPALWAELESGAPDWQITGEGIFSLSSMTAGMENTFEFKLEV